MWRLALVALVLVVGVASVPVVYSLDLRDDRLPAGKAEQLLRDRLRTKEPFTCEAIDEDRAHPTLAIDDADYFCEGDDGGYWIGTDEDEITGIQFAG